MFRLISNLYFDQERDFAIILLLYFRFIGEETTAETNEKIVLTDAPTWIIDPVDGTMNFVHGLPHSCISIALVVNKVTEIGVIYNPMLEQLFTARRNGGAFLNGIPIHVSGEKGTSHYKITSYNKYFNDFFSQQQLSIYLYVNRRKLEVFNLHFL